MARASVSVSTITGSNGAVPSGAALATFGGTSSSTSVTGTITVPPNGVALIAGAMGFTSGVPTVTPTNYTTYGGPVDSGTGQFWYAYGYDTTPGSRSYTMTWGNGVTPAAPTGIFAAWGP